MPRRNLIPLVLVIVLLVLALVFAVLGQSSAPNRSSLRVQNATSATFGDPTGTESFSLQLTDSLSATLTTGATTERRLIVYTAPDLLTVSQYVGTRTVRVATLGPAAIPCVLGAYASIVDGSTPWMATGDNYTRDESLADYSGRVPHLSGRTCTPQPSAVRGTVAERAILKAGYLIDLTLIVSVPPQRLANGKEAAHGTEGERLQLLSIGHTAVAKL